MQLCNELMQHQEAQLMGVSARITDSVDEVPATKKLMSNDEKPSIGLYDLPVDGRALPIRWALAYAEIPFEEKNVTVDQSGRVPWMTLTSSCGKTEKLVGVSSILNYIGTIGNLIPKDDAEAKYMYDVIQTSEETYDKIDELLKEQKATDDPMEIHHISNRMTSCLLELDNSLKDDKYVVGGRMTLADLCVASLVHICTRDTVDAERFWEQDVLAMNIFKRVMRYPEIKYYMNSHMHNPTFYCFSRDAGIAWMLKHANIEHTWVCLSETSTTDKSLFMELGGKRYHKIWAVIKYVAERADLIPITLEHRVNADAIFWAFHSVAQLIDIAPESDKIPEFETRMDVVEKLVSQTSSIEGYLVENHLTWIDFYIAAELKFACDQKWIVDEVSDKWPVLAKTLTNMLTCCR